jgi:iron complex outermembrane receptor protein
VNDVTPKESRMRVATLLAVLVLGDAVGAPAQAPPPTLPPVIVEGAATTPERTRTEEEAREELQRVPGSVDLIGAQEIGRSRAANLKDVLDFTPGVLIRPRFGAADESQLSIRGSGLRNNFHLRGVNVLIDGFPYGNADGFADFEALELLDVKRIEVYKGGNALRFGGNTLGGAVNLVTKTGHDAGLFELRSEVGSFGYLKHHAATGQAYGPFDLYAAFTDTELDGFRAHADQTRRRAVVSLGYTLGGGTTLRLDLGYVHSRESLPGALTRDEFEANPRQRNPAARFADEARNYDYLRGAFTLRTPLTATQALEWSTQLNYQDMDHPLAFAVIDDTTYSWSTELRYLLTAPLLGLGHRFTAGLQYFDTRQMDVNFANVGSARRGALTKRQVNEATNVGLYAEDQLDVTPAVTGILGARAQYAIRTVRDRFLVNGNQSDSVDFLSLSPRAGLIVRVTPDVQLYGNASHSYEPPLLLELTAPGQIGGNLGQLAAQKAWQFEVGTRGRLAADRLLWDVSVFDIELWDEIQNVNVPPFPGAPFTIPRFRNIDRSRHTGVEVGLDALLVKDVARRLGLGEAGDALRARAAYTWSRFVFVDDVNFGDNDLPGAPRHFLRAELRYDHRSGFWIAPGVEVVPQGYFVNSENTKRTSPYELFGVRLGYDHARSGLGVFFEARNLADTRYISSVVVDSAAGRYIEPGDGRAFYGGVAWRWR